MIRLAALISCIFVLTGPSFAQEAAPSREEQIYRDARSAIGDAKVRASRADISTRKAVLARETDARLKAVASKWGLDKASLARIIADGEAKDGRAARQAQLDARKQAKAIQQAKTLVPAAPPIFLPMPGMTQAERKGALRAAGVIPPKR